MFYWQTVPLNILLRQTFCPWPIPAGMNVLYTSEPIPYKRRNMGGGEPSMSRMLPEN